MINDSMSLSNQLDSQLTDIIKAARELARGSITYPLSSRVNRPSFQNIPNMSSKPARYLEYPLEILTFNVRFGQKNEPAERVKLFKQLNLLILAYDIPEKKNQINHFSSAYFFHPEHPCGGWQIDRMIKLDKYALANPLSEHTELNYSVDPRLQSEINALRQRAR